jgi:4-amino-4-deoxy-L-arabinose transferase-like glycosyltransferase
LWLRVHLLPELPPGLHYDEAANAILAGDIGLRGARPVFITGYTGKETLFFWLAGGMMRLVGESVFALRLTAAFTGVLTVAAGSWLARELWPRRPWIAVWVALLLATAFPHVLFSRLGFRAITLPLMATLTLAALWRSSRLRSAHWAVIAGLWLGLTAHTYLAARLFPLLLLPLVPLLFRPFGRYFLRQTSLLTGAALLTAGPLLAWFWRNPDSFWVRIGQVTPAAGSAASGYGDGILRALGMLFVEGDPYWRFNLPYRPIFNPPLALLLLAGTLLLLARWRHASPRSRAAILLALTGPLVMLLPTALAIGEITPSNLRALGIWPLVLLPIGYALERMREQLPARLHPFTPLLVLLTLVPATLTTWHRYSGWAARNDVVEANDADLVAIGRFLDTTPAPDDPLLVAALHYRHPTVAFTSARYDDVRWLVGGNAFAEPATLPAWLLFPRSAPPPAWLTERLPPPLPGPAGPDGAPLFLAWHLQEAVAWAGERGVSADFGDLITLDSLTIRQTAPDQVRVWLHWHTHAPGDRPWRPFIHLRDRSGHLWSAGDSIAWLAEQWRPGERLIQALDLALPDGMPPGDYTVAISLYDGKEVLALRDAAGRHAGPAALVDGVTLTGNPQPTTQQPPHVVGAEPVAGLRLIGYERGGATVETGTTFPLTLWWQAEQPLPDLRTRLILACDDGPPLPWFTTDPALGQSPFATWNSPVFVRDRQVVAVSADFPGGTCTIALTLITPDGTPAAPPIPLGPLTIVPTERLFELPDIAQRLEARFGEEIVLAGSELVPQPEENAVQLRLVWQAVAAPERDYTLFVHLLHPDGRCCLWQQDAMPRQNSYPTTRWLPGEVVVETITIPTGALPAGEYGLALGLYLAQTGQRLPVVVEGKSADFLSLPPLRVPPE